LGPLPTPKIVFLEAERPAMEMEKYIHRENLTLFKRRLSEAHTDAEREVVLKLLANEEAKEPSPKNGIL